MDDVHLHRWGSPRTTATVAVLAVHGRGQNPAVMQEYSSHLQARGVNYFAPRAAGDSWYPEPFLVPFSLNEKDVGSGLDVVDNALDQLRIEGFDPRRTVLWGFSQGACLLSHHLLTRRPQVGGALLFTGGYVGAELLEVPAGSELSGLPIIVRSIEHDPWVPPWRVEQTAVLLRALGAQVNLRIAPGGDHIITDEAYSAADRLLERLGATPESPSSRRSDLGGRL